MSRKPKRYELTVGGIKTNQDESKEFLQSIAPDDQDWEIHMVFDSKMNQSSKIALIGHLNEQDIARAIQMNKRGFSWHKIAARYSVTQVNLMSSVKEYGYDPKTQKYLEDVCD